MTETKNITTASQEVFASASRDFIMLQNDSDTDFFYDLGPQAVPLTTDNGIRLESGEMLILDEPVCSLAIRMIHGGTGNKSLRTITG